MCSIVANAPVDRWHLKAIQARLMQYHRQEIDGTGTTVLVIDTGINAKHFDLNGKVAAAWEKINGRYQPVDPEASRDSFGHGTSVASLICGQSCGVATGARVASLVLSKLKNNAATGGVQTSESELLSAMDFAATIDSVQVVNISAGVFPTGRADEVRKDYWRALQRIADSGKIPVIAVGNEMPPRLPGMLDNGVSVGAYCQELGGVSDFSAYGEFANDRKSYAVPNVVAPGSFVPVACNQCRYFDHVSGTSFAAPIVSGAAALWIQANGTASARNFTRDLSRFSSPLRDERIRQGFGLLDLHALLDRGKRNIRSPIVSSSGSGGTSWTLVR